MTDVSTPLAAESQTTEAPRVSVLVTAVEGADLDAALAAVRRQVYDPVPEVFVIGEQDSDLPEGTNRAANLEEAISATGSDVEYLWLLHSDARPRPDALGALVGEVERSDAAVGGSKLLVAGTPEVLESVGSATDVFGEPHSGLDAGEIDLQQYDVVREVAFVSSASMLARRDLAQGLRGLDEKLPPVAAGLDFSQRARLAGGRVVIVPSSEVYHQKHCREHTEGWKEQAGRHRAMITVYSLLTLLWVLPYQLLNAIVHSVASLALLRWRPPVRHLLSWLWNTYQLPSTIGARFRFRKVRLLGDEELFRFQSRGSVQLRAVGSELSNRVLSVFDEDQALARGSKRIWGSPGIWGAVVSVLILVLAARTVFFVGVPNNGFSFPFEPPSIALDRWLAGWNDSGLGSPAPVHPSTGLTGLVSWLWFGAEGAARTLLTIAFGVLGVLGLGRLSGRLGLRGPGRYLAGLVLLSGPGTALVVGRGSWLALAAAGVLPWAIRGAFVHEHEQRRGLITNIGWAVLAGVPLAVLSPVLAAVPLTSVVLWKLLGGKEGSFVLGLASLLGLLGAISFLVGDPAWLIESGRRLGLTPELFWPLILVVAFIPLLLASARVRRLGALGAMLGLGGIILTRVDWAGPGVEETGLILTSLGAALLVAAGLDVLTWKPSHLLASIGAAAVLILSITPLANGRLGLPAGDLNERIEFAGTLTDESGPGRILVASLERELIPGEARSGPGFWYRVVDGAGMTSDEVWLPSDLAGDRSLASELNTIASGAELRPGERLAPFAIEWILLVGPSFRLDEVFVAQLDLLPTPLDPESRVYQNPSSRPLADAGPNSSWARDGVGFTGDAASGRVILAINHDDGWNPESAPVKWQATVSAADGEAVFKGPTRNLAFAVGAAALVLLALGLAVAGRVMKP